MTAKVAGVCWFSSARYSQPLTPSQAKKWAAMAALGHPLFVIGFADDVRFRRFHEGAQLYLLPKLPFPLLRYAIVFTLMPLLALVLALRGEVKIIVAQSPYEGAAAALVKMAARLLGRRVALVIEAHGDFEESYFLYRDIPFKSLVRGLMTTVSSFALAHADVLRPVSSLTWAQLARRAPDKPIEQLIAWIDIDAFRHAPRQMPPSQSNTLIYAGVLVPLKGVHILLQAFATLTDELPDARLALAGQALNEGYHAQLQQQVAELRLEQRVTFLGQLEQAALAQQIAAARAFVLPSFSEGLSRVLVEAMATGTPVIATRVGGLPDIVEDEVTGYLVPAGDTDALAGAIRKMMTLPTVDDMGEQAQAHSRQLFSTDAYVEGHRRIFARASEGLNG